MKKHRFYGGYKFARFFGSPAENYSAIDLPLIVSIPLQQGFGCSIKSLVNIGENVFAGQIIARDDQSISSPIHSSVNGKVIAIEKRSYFNREIETVVIEGDGTDEVDKLQGYSKDWEKLEKSEIERLIYESGASALGRQGIPTQFNSSIIIPEKVEDLIIYGIESEVFNISISLLLKDQKLYNFIQGIKILSKVMPQARIFLVINKEQEKIVELFKNIASEIKNLKLVPIVSKYPREYNEVLVPTITGKRLKHGDSSANIGVITLDFQSVLHVYDAVCKGIPLVERVVALCGEGFKEPIHARVRIGSPLETIIKNRIYNDFDVRVVYNSLLTGLTLNDFSIPIDITFNQIIAILENNNRELFSFLRSGLRSDSYSPSFLSSYLNTNKRVDTNKHGEERPCIQCGYCIEICPVNLLPSLLYRHSKISVSENLISYNILDCIDCNLCSYVCPSKISLAKCIKDTKDKIVKSNFNEVSTTI